jgi:filamentous hemagglutinin
MKPRSWLGLAAAVLMAVLGSRWLADPAPRTASPSAAPTEQVAPGSPAAREQVAAGDLVVRGVTVRDRDGRIAWRGDVDLRPVLARIEAGERDEHANDGGVFGNRERLLPAQPGGYYREYVVRTPGISHAGPQRLVVGRNGEIFYTSDHYASFERIR